MREPDGRIIGAEEQIGLLRTMIRIRAFEERVRDLFAAGRLPGFVHLGIARNGRSCGLLAGNGLHALIPFYVTTNSVEQRDGDRLPRD